MRGTSPKKASKRLRIFNQAKACCLQSFCFHDHRCFLIQLLLTWYPVTRFTTEKFSVELFNLNLKRLPPLYSEGSESPDSEGHVGPIKESCC